MKEKKEIMTVKEFADASGLKECAVRRLVKEQRVCYMKIGSRYYINYPRSMEFLINSPIADIVWTEPKKMPDFN